MNHLEMIRADLIRRGLIREGKPYLKVDRRRCIYCGNDFDVISDGRQDRSCSPCKPRRLMPRATRH